MPLKIVQRWPLLVAAFFCAYATVLLVISFRAEEQLRMAAETRLVADNIQQAATLSDFGSDLINAVEGMANSHPVEVFLVNRALGMSIQYGLNSSLDAIDELFRAQAEKKLLRGEAIYQRIVYFDENGEKLEKPLFRKLKTISNNGMFHLKNMYLRDKNDLSERGIPLNPTNNFTQIISGVHLEEIDAEIKRWG